MRTSLLFSLWVGVTLLSTTLHAEVWTAADGAVAVTVPDDLQLLAVPTPPAPFVALWMTDDAAVKLGVVASAVPTHVKLDQTMVEQGLETEIGGPVTRLPTKTVGGQEVWRMSAEAPGLAISQAIFRHEGTVYKLMALTTPEFPDTAAIDAFFDSLAITKPAAKGAQAPVAPPGETTDSHRLSKLIGGAAGVLVLGLLGYFFWQRRKK